MRWVVEQQDKALRECMQQVQNLVKKTNKARAERDGARDQMSVRSLRQAARVVGVAVDEFIGPLLDAKDTDAFPNINAAAGFEDALSKDDSGMVDRLLRAWAVPRKLQIEQGRRETDLEYRKRKKAWRRQRASVGLVPVLTMLRIQCKTNLPKWALLTSLLAEAFRLPNTWRNFSRSLGSQGGRDQARTFLDARIPRMLKSLLEFVALHADDIFFMYVYWSY